VTDAEAEVKRAEDPLVEDRRGEDPRAEDTLAEPGSRRRQYRKRIEEWASALRAGAEQHAPPEVLSGLAATAKNIALSLDGMAARARVKQAKEEAPLPAPTEQVPAPTAQAESPSKN
jgi:hypothetical protein